MLALDLDCPRFLLAAGTRASFVSFSSTHRVGRYIYCKRGEEGWRSGSFIINIDIDNDGEIDGQRLVGFMSNREWTDRREKVMVAR